MNRENVSIHIIGAGVSGLIAAMNLEQNGYRPVLWEATDRVGGRVKTDVIEGFQLDRGFQVLPEAYEMVQKYLDLDALKLQSLYSGVLIFRKNAKTQCLGNPFHNFSFWWKNLLRPAVSISDFYYLGKLFLKLKQKKEGNIFNEEDQTTLRYLQENGFSDAIIEQFFRPFYGGIFLEDELSTSSRMFEFVFKMFSEGCATIPKGGMEEIPKQLYERLFRTKTHFNSRIDQVESGRITMDGVDTISTDFTIIATEASSIVDKLPSNSTKWNSCETLYFATSERKFSPPIIALLPGRAKLVNHIFYPSSMEQTNKSKKEFLSVNIIKSHDLSEEELIKAVKRELAEIARIEDLEFLRRYRIECALPQVPDPRNDIDAQSTKLMEGVYLAGDSMLNPSLNGAIKAGELAAKAVMEKHQGRENEINY
jgi:protoporphyrinogen oxidase